MKPIDRAEFYIRAKSWSDVKRNDKELLKLFQRIWKDQGNDWSIRILHCCNVCDSMYVEETKIKLIKIIWKNNNNIVNDDVLISTVA